METSNILDNSLLIFPELFRINHLPTLVLLMDGPWMGRARIKDNYPDSKVHGANMGPIWGRQDPGGPHVGPMNLAIVTSIKYIRTVWARGILRNFALWDWFCISFIPWIMQKFVLGQVPTDFIHILQAFYNTSRTSPPGSVNQRWRIWIQESHGCTENDDINETKHNIIVCIFYGINRETRRTRS